MKPVIKIWLPKFPQLEFIAPVLSFGSIIRVAEDLNKKELQSLEIAVLYSKIPDEIKKEIVSPYISVDKDEARISVRIKDSLKDLRRNDLINKLLNKIKTPANLYSSGLRFNLVFNSVSIFLIKSFLLKSFKESFILTLILASLFSTDI